MGDQFDHMQVVVKKRPLLAMLRLPGLEDERQQFQDDTEWLRRKLDYLRGDLDNESEHI